jgi:TatA/E family protein of Tat protein translocase
MGEITVILVLALIFLGPKKLPDLATSLGKLIREIRKATSDIKSEITLDDTFRKPFEELRDAVMLHPDELKRRDQVKKVMEETRLRLDAELRAAAAAPAVDPVPVEAGVAAETPTSGASDAPIDAQAPPQILPPVAPPLGTVASSRALPAGNEPGGEMAAAVPAGIMTSARSVAPSRVAPRISSLSGNRANATQSLSEADLLPNPQPRQKRPPPPLPGLDKAAAPPPPVGLFGPPRVTPPISSLSGDRANVTQVLSESDLLPPAAPPVPVDAAKPPPTPGSKKT